MKALAEQTRVSWFGILTLFTLILLMGVSCANSAPRITTFPATNATIVNIAASHEIYTDALSPTWENWSWDSTLDFAANAPVHSGNAAIAVTYTAGWAGLSLRTTPALATTDLEALTFWIYGNGAPLSVSL